jgi:predicted nucleic acid binding AN1-type Zn finger protein
VELLKSTWDKVSTSIESATGKTVGFFAMLTPQGSRDMRRNAQLDQVLKSNPNLSEQEADTIVTEYNNDPRSQVVGKGKNRHVPLPADLDEFAKQKAADAEASRKAAVAEDQNNKVLSEDVKQLEKLKGKYQEIADLKDKAAYDEMSDKDKLTTLDKKIQEEKNKQNFSQGPLDSDSMADSAKKQAELEQQRAELVKKTDEEKKKTIKEIGEKQAEIDKTSADRQMEKLKKNISTSEEQIKRLEQEIKKTIPVDSLKAHGGGISNVKYPSGPTPGQLNQLNTAEDQLKRQEMELQREQLIEQKKQTDAAEQQLNYLKNLLQNNPSFNA